MNEVLCDCKGGDIYVWDSPESGRYHYETCPRCRGTSIVQVHTAPQPEKARSFMATAVQAIELAYAKRRGRNRRAVPKDGEGEA